jgi:hypothetical protein
MKKEYSPSLILDTTIFELKAGFFGFYLPKKRRNLAWRTSLTTSSY